jgi:hypothetical protein
MTTRITLLLALLSVPAAGPASAQEERSAPIHRFSLELNLVQPFIPTVHILRPKLAVTLWGEGGGLRGDLVLGAYLRPHVEHDVVDHIDEYMGTLGYRQYLWRGLHLESLISAGAAWGTNRFDGKYYNTPSVFIDVNAGYRFAFFEPGGFFESAGAPVGLFLTAQAGILFSAGVANIGPRNGKPDWFPQAELLAGVSF